MTNSSTGGDVGTNIMRVITKLGLPMSYFVVHPIDFEDSNISAVRVADEPIQGGAYTPMSRMQ